MPDFYDRLKRKWGILPTFDACGRVIVARSGEPLRFPLHTSPSLRTFFDSLKPPALQKESRGFSLEFTRP